MLSIGQAMRVLVPCFAPLGAIERGLLEAQGCVLARDVIATTDLPRFDDSAMDGYAVRHADVAKDTPMRVQGLSRAGAGLPAPLAPHSAMRIFTGAPLPSGADTVIIQENATVAGDGGVIFTQLPRARAHVRHRGSDLTAGSVALSAGSALGPGELGLIASLNLRTVAVNRPPRVAIVSVGDELRTLGSELPPGTIVGSNGIALAAQLRALGAEPWLLDAAPDRVDAICDVLREALRADVVLTSGGVSVGDYDHMAEAFSRIGVQRRFAKVAIKPGKPLWFGTAGAVPVVGLPGNPVSAMVTFEVFVRPALRRMLGHAAPYPVLVEVVLDHDHRHGTGRPELARGALHAGARGELRVRLHGKQGSGSLPSMAQSDALVLLDAATERFDANQHLRALLLEGGPYQREPAFA